MVTIDTLKVGFPATALRDFNEDFFFDQTASFKGEIFRHYKTLKKEVLGVDTIRIDGIEGNGELRTSSKALEERYPEMINQNNLPALIDNWRQKGIIDLDYDEFLNESEVYEAHVTKDIKLSKDMSEYFKDLYYYLTQYNYRAIDYSPYGLEVSGTAKTNSKRLIFYDKYKELSRRIRINEILSKYIPAIAFKDIFRIEGRMSDFRTLRKFFGLEKGESPSLKKIIESDINPCQLYFDYLFPQLKIDKSLLSASESDKSFNELEKELAMRNIIEQFNYDLPAIIKFIKTKVKGNLTSYRSRYKRMLIQMKAEKLGSEFKTVEEIRDKLKEKS